MKATGIVRRIDDLGRVVIPKEIRRTLKIREGDPLEIFTGAGGEVVFKKYSPMGEMAEFAGDYAEAIFGSTNFPVIICDRDHCVAAAGISKKEALGRNVTAYLDEIMENRKCFFTADAASPALEGVERCFCVACPIMAAGDVSGVVALLAGEGLGVATDSDIKLVTVAASFLGRQTE
ncbi:MAG: AbrB/MazE/SpoVT family DNA-binding domain-containing protein [Clostridia bacterium]|nr:AbrB/MazE/SpoVT family DNA-binding domain-containing protein [Clostridia bacterium]